MKAIPPPLILIPAFVGALLVYSDATHERPIHTQAAVGIFLLWFALAVIVIGILELLDRTH